MRASQLAAIGLVAYAIGLVVTAPAGLVDTALDDASDGRLRLAETRGTLWAGSALIELRDVAGRRSLAEGCDWQLTSISLRRAALIYAIRVAPSLREFPLTLSLSDINVSDADLVVPAEVLGLVLPRLAPLGLGGELAMKVRTLSLAPEELQGQARVQWRNASSTLTPISPLGAYDIEIDAASSGTRMRVHTLEGPLQLDGHVALATGAAAVFRIVAKVPKAHRPQLAPLLTLVSVERSEGVFEFVP